MCFGQRSQVRLFLVCVLGFALEITPLYELQIRLELAFGRNGMRLSFHWE